MRALMLAAGVGERLRPHTNFCAKPAIPFLNIPMMGFPMFFLEQAGLSELVVNTHHLPATVEGAARSLVRRKVALKFSPEEGEILGSGGGLAKAQPLFEGGRSGAEVVAGNASGKVKDEIVICNADAVTLFRDASVVRQLIERHRRHSAAATLLLCPFPTSNENFGGVYVDAEGWVRKFSKTKLTDPNLTGHHFTAFLVVGPEVWQGLTTKPSNLFYEVLQPKIDAGMKVQSLIMEGALAFETGNPLDYLAATKTCLEILSTPGPLQRTLIGILDRFTPDWWKGWRTSPTVKVLGSLPWPDRLQVTDFAVFGAEAQFGLNVHLERSVVAGPVTLMDGRHLKDQLLVGEEDAGLRLSSASGP